MKVRHAAIALLLALAAGVIAVPLGASAASARPAAKTTAANPFAGIQLTGTASPTSGNGKTLPFSGSLTLTHFAQKSGHLVATGTLLTTLPTAAGSLETVVTQVTVPMQATGTCPILHLDIGPITLNLLGLQITTSEIVVDITAVQGPGNLLGNLLCAIAHLLDNPNAGMVLAQLLNNILRLLFGQAGMVATLGGIPLTGMTPSGAVVHGSLTISQFASQGGQLVALGTVQTPNGSAPVVVPLQATGGCPILHLVIGPINLNLLGLQITTNQIVLDITAIPGPGNLLGNLLCSLAGLLNNPGALTGLLANLLNQILMLLMGL